MLNCKILLISSVQVLFDPSHKLVRLFVLLIKSRTNLTNKRDLARSY